MTNTAVRTGFSLLTALSMAGLSSAQAYSARMSREVYYRQTSASALDFDYQGADFELRPSAGSALTSASFLNPRGEVEAMPMMGIAYGGGGYSQSPEEAASQWPAGGYSIRGYAGAEQIYGFSLPSTPGFTAEMAPRFLNFDEITKARAGRDLPVRVAGFTALPGSNIRYVSAYVMEYLDGVYVRNVMSIDQMNSNDLSFTIPGSELRPGREYLLGSHSQSNTLFPDKGLGYQSYFAQAQNQMRFVAVPEPATLAALGLGALALLRRRRP